MSSSGSVYIGDYEGKLYPTPLEDGIGMLLGRRIIDIYINASKTEIRFHTKLAGASYGSPEEIFLMYHDQNCCESVTIEDIEGDLTDLVGNVILQAAEVTNQKDTFGKKDLDSFTWTFYKLASRAGYVTIRWLGESNGYYSESVEFKKIQ